MTVEAWALAAVAAVFILAYIGAKERAERWQSMAERALTQSELMAKKAQELSNLLRDSSESNLRLATLLGRAIMKLKEREDEADWWKKGSPE